MSQKIIHQLRDKEWRPARSDGGSTTQSRWLVINFPFNSPQKKPMKKVVTGRFLHLIFLDAAHATGLVGLVPLPATPWGHRPSPVAKN